jgi:hypothetical protein
MNIAIIGAGMGAGCGHGGRRPDGAAHGPELITPVD